MEKIIFRVIIITGACCLSAKHVFISKQLSWYDARNYCNNTYADLSCLTSEQDINLFKSSVGEDNEGWIGAYLDKSYHVWKWSDGENVTNLNNLDIPVWDGTSTAPHYKDNVSWKKDGWEWHGGWEPRSFFCFTLTLVQQEKTWEEALVYCRENGSDFTSLVTNTENMMAANEINQKSGTEQVWIGLRYLGDRWLWVNGDPLEYQAWSQGGDQDQLCPVKRRCGALTKDGAWENWDCQEKLHFICA